MNLKSLQIVLTFVVFFILLLSLSGCRSQNALLSKQGDSYIPYSYNKIDKKNYLKIRKYRYTKKVLLIGWGGGQWTKKDVFTYGLATSDRETIIKPNALFVKLYLAKGYNKESNLITLPFVMAERKRKTIIYTLEGEKIKGKDYFKNGKAILMTDKGLEYFLYDFRENKKIGKKYYGMRWLNENSLRAEERQYIKEKDSVLSTYITINI